MDPVLNTCEEHDAILKASASTNNFTLTYSKEALIDLIRQQLPHNDPTACASKASAIISEPTPSPSSPFQDKLIKAFLEKLGPVWHEFYAFSLKDFCQLAMLKILLNCLDAAKGSKHTIKCLQLYAELVEALQSNPKEANLLILSFFKERLPGLLQTPLPDFQAIVNDIASIAGLAKCHQGTYREVFHYQALADLESVYSRGVTALIAVQEQFLKLAIEQCSMQKRLLNNLKAKHALGERSKIKETYFDGVSKIFNLLNRTHAALDKQESLFTADLHTLQMLRETAATQESLRFLTASTAHEMQRLLQQLALFQTEIESYQTSLCYLTDLNKTPASIELNSQVEHLGILAISSLWRAIEGIIHKHKMHLDPTEKQLGLFPDLLLFLAKLFAIYRTHSNENKARRQINALKQQWNQTAHPWFNALIEDLIATLPRLLSENLELIVQREKTLLRPVENFWGQSLTALSGGAKHGFQQKILKCAPESFSTIAKTLPDYRKKEFNAYHYLDELSQTLQNTSALLLKFPQLLNSPSENSKLAFITRPKEKFNAEECLLINFCFSLLESEMHAVAILKQALCPLWRSLSTASQSLLPFLPQKKDVDLEALWLQRVEMPHRKEKQIAVFDNFESESSEEEDALIAQPNVPIKATLIVANPLSESTLAALSRSVMPPSLVAISSVSKLALAAHKKMFTYDMAFHLKLMDSSLELLQRLLQQNSSSASVQAAIAMLLNSTYYALEQARTPYVTGERTTLLTHGLKHLYEHKPAILPLNLLTVWYRYPYFSLALRSRSSVDLPQGLKMLLTPQPVPKQLELLQKVLPRALELLFAAAKLHTTEPLDCLSAATLWQEWQARLHLPAEIKLSPTSSGFSDALTKSSLRLERLKPSLQSHYAHYFSNSDKNVLELATYQDLMTHLERLQCALQHLSAFSEQQFICLHASQILMCGQYLTELSFVLQSIKEKNELRTHELGTYRKLLQKQYPPRLWEFIENYLNIGKGLDYPFWTFYKYRGRLNQGMTLLSQAYSLAKHTDGFIEAHTKTTCEALRHTLQDIAEGIIDVLEHSISE